MSDMGGPQMIPHSEIVTFGERVLNLPSDLISFFSTAMEVIDDAVMQDHCNSKKSR